MDNQGVSFNRSVQEVIPASEMSSLLPHKLRLGCNGMHRNITKGLTKYSDRSLEINSGTVTLASNLRKNRRASGQRSFTMRSVEIPK